MANRQRSLDKAGEQKYLKIFSCNLFNPIFPHQTFEMIFSNTKISGVFVIDVEKISDNRGFFGRSYCTNEFERQGLNTSWVQTNISLSLMKGTLRGLHLQVHPHEEAKLIRCTRGAIYDVIVDLRKASTTYLKWFGIELKAEECKMLYMPEGCAHGYISLLDGTEVTYQVSRSYTPGSEIGYLWNDPSFCINWPIEPTIISDKDQSHGYFKS